MAHADRVNSPAKNALLTWCANRGDLKCCYLEEEARKKPRVALVAKTPEGVNQLEREFTSWASSKLPGAEIHVFDPDSTLMGFDYTADMIFDASEPPQRA